MSIEYRLMKPEESKEAVKLARRSFPFWYRLIIHGFKDAVIAVDNGEIVGGAAWHIIETKNGSFGYLDFGFTEKNHRGRGIGRETYTRVMNHFQESKCDAAGAIVLNDKTASWRLLADNGCSRSSASGLINRYGFSGALRIWFESAFVFSPGAELWTTAEIDRPPVSSAKSIIIFLLANFCLAVLISVRHGNGLDFITALLVVALLLFRLLITGFIAERSDISLSFSFWRSGWMLPFFVFLGGGLFPLGGDFYPSEKKWDYPAFRKQAGLLGLGSWLSVIIPAVFILYVKYFIPDSVSVFNGVVQWIYMMLIFHSVPVLLESWPGNRVLKWSRALFAVLFTISVLILVLIFL